VTAVALRSQNGLAQERAADMVSALYTARLEMDEASAQVASDTAKQAALVREWVRIQKASATIGVEATRLEMTALRRLGQLGALESLTPTAQAAAKGFAGMTVSAFTELVADVSKATSASRVWTRHSEHSKEAARYDLGARIGAGIVDTPVCSDPRELMSAAQTLLDHVVASGQITSVSSAAEMLATRMDILSDYKHDPVVRKGVRETVRYALMNAGDQDDCFPKFISYQEAEAGWVHIPLATATVRHLRFHDEYRQRQAEQMRASADKSRALYLHFAGLADDESVCVGDLLRASKAVHEQ
jgi:hypothetical protein